MKKQYIGNLWNNRKDNETFTSGKIDLGPLGRVKAYLRKLQKEQDNQPDFGLYVNRSQIGAFWYKDNEGNRYLSGNILGVQVTIFKNHKEKDTDSDYSIVRYRESENKESVSKSD